MLCVGLLLYRPTVRWVVYCYTGQYAVRMQEYRQTAAASVEFSLNSTTAVSS